MSTLLDWRMRLQALWERSAPPPWWLRLLEQVYLGLRAAAAWPWQRGWRVPARLPVPVVVVGNLRIGGTGKTPLVIELARHLRQRGISVGVVSRGYGRRTRGIRTVDRHSRPSEVGDEPLLMAAHGIPVVVGEDRAVAALRLHDLVGVELILADDGLEHHGLSRQLEIVVRDGERGEGNGHCLPAGPLRAPPSRAAACALKVQNGGTPMAGWHSMQLRSTGLRRLRDGEHQYLPDWRGRQVHALAGIGHPARFFASLAGLGLKVQPHPLPDHYDFASWPSLLPREWPVVVTTKDAIKLDASTIPQEVYVLEVSAELPAAFWQAFDQAIDGLLQVRP